jgi:prepilin-type N-terminal cleavage/methylation domain-containing protein
MVRMNKMSRRAKGFTLIELVVVVLIIGILAAVAIAQYNRAVEKGRMAEAFNEFTALKGAQTRYLLKYNTYTNSTSDLDITAPTTKYFGAVTITATAAAYTAALTRTGNLQATYSNYTVSYQGPQGTMSCSCAACANDLLP